MKLYVQLFTAIIGFLRWRFSALLVLMALVGLTEGLAIALLLPLLLHMGISSSVQGAAGLTLNRVLMAIATYAGTLGTLFIVFGVAAAQAVLSVLLQSQMVRAARAYQSRRQSQLFAAFMHAQWEFVISRKSGELTNVIVSESERLAQAFMVGLYVVSTSIITCIYLLFALVIAWQITLGLIGCALLMTFSVLPLYRKSFTIGMAIAPLNAELQSVLGERISGVKIVKATTGEEVTAAQVDQILGKLQRANTLANMMPPAVRSIFELLAFVTLAGVFVLGQQTFGIAPGNVIVVFALFVRLFPRITTLQGYLHMLNGYVHALDAIDALQAAAEGHAERTGKQSGRLSVPLPSQLQLHNVDVQFGTHKVLNHVELTLPIPGMIGIVGASGAGKSTLVHAVLGLLEPSAGSIRLGQHDLHSSPLRAWRRAIGYVPQETILFHTSIRENLKLADPAASADEIETTVRRAHADDFIAALPEGLDTVIGDQGVKLSGGQRQRLGIARALLGKPILLLMDEAMSALDAESEVHLLHSVELLRKEMGILIVAHRLAAVRTADTIYVMEDGRIVEFGTWNELMARRTRLYALAEAQSSTDDRSLAAS